MAAIHRKESMEDFTSGSLFPQVPEDNLDSEMPSHLMPNYDYINRIRFFSTEELSYVDPQIVAIIRASMKSPEQQGETEIADADGGGGGGAASVDEEISSEETVTTCCLSYSEIPERYHCNYNGNNYDIRWLLSSLLFLEYTDIRSPFDPSHKAIDATTRRVELTCLCDHLGIDYNKFINLWTDRSEIAKREHYVEIYRRRFGSAAVTQNLLLKKFRTMQFANNFQESLDPNIIKFLCGEVVGNTIRQLIYEGYIPELQPMFSRFL